MSVEQLKCSWKGVLFFFLSLTVDYYRETGKMFQSLKENSHAKRNTVRPEMYVIRYMMTSISVTKCPLRFIVK